MTRWAVPAAIAVTAVTFSLYRATLLPGFDFGDTASFQTMVGSPIITPRDGYPLYFAVSAAFLRLVGGEAAYSLNLASAVEAALACGVLTLVAAALSGSVLAGVGSALLFAGSYTFWSQSIIAEVYALHILTIGLTLGLLLRWEQRPTLTRLGVFFGVYAIAFGNHLSMILLAPAYTCFLLTSAPGAWRSLVTRPVVALALTAASVGALQYAWNLRTSWFGLYPPDGSWTPCGRDGSTSPKRIGGRPWPCRFRQEWRATTRRCTASTCSSSSGGLECSWAHSDWPRR